MQGEVVRCHNYSGETCREHAFGPTLEELCVPSSVRQDHDPLTVRRSSVSTVVILALCMASCLIVFFGPIACVQELAVCPQPIRFEGVLGVFSVSRF